MMVKERSGSNEYADFKMVMALESIQDCKEVRTGGRVGASKHRKATLSMVLGNDNYFHAVTTSTERALSSLDKESLVKIQMR